MKAKIHRESVSYRDQVRNFKPTVEYTPDMKLDWAAYKAWYSTLRSAVWLLDPSLPYEVRRVYDSDDRYVEIYQDGACGNVPIRFFKKG